MTTTDINHFHLAQCIGSLRIEVNTGMRHSQGSVLKLTQQLYGVKSRTKKGALQELEDLYEATFGRRYGDTSRQASVP